jgi:glucose/arabinose dehydrogenase
MPVSSLRLAVSSVASVLLALPLAGLSAVPAAAAAEVDFVEVVSGLDQPTHVTSARDGSGRLFVTEKTGRVRVVRDGDLLERPFLDLRSLVKPDGEGGLLSIAFHPDYRDRPYVWVAYTNNAGDLRVARFRARSADADQARRSTFTRVIDVPHPAQFTNHFAGQLAFGRTGLLFVSTGDGGGGGDPSNHAQSTRSLQGKILRLKVVGARKACGRAYCVPRGNPFRGRTPGQGEVWALGLRNPWRFSVDPATGDLWVADVGQNRFEEVDRIPAGEGGLNLGWSCREATVVYDESRCGDDSLHEPEWSYGSDYGRSITGGFVYRGEAYADAIGGLYVGGDFVSGRVFVGDTTGITTVGELDGVTSFGEDGDRELWAVTIDGSLYRLTASSAPA